MLAWLYTWLPRICGCHCRPDRSFFWHGRQFPVCARCTGELIGFLAAIPGGIFLGFHPVWSLLMLLPLIVDGTVQLKTAYESTNLRRVITGFLFGYGLVTLLIWTLIRSYQFGYSLTAG